MKRLLARDIPPRAAIVVLALVLLASVVGGREKAPDAQVAPAATKQASDEAAKAEDLAVETLTRQRSEREREDLFASRSWAPPPAAAQPAAPAKPAPPPVASAPPLPFKYLGRRADAERLVVYLARGEDTFNAVVGDTLQNTYSVEGISESAVQFIYLPLGTRQSLSIPPPQ
jgi:hypothetical protein